MLITGKALIPMRFQTCDINKGRQGRRPPPCQGSGGPPCPPFLLVRQRISINAFVSLWFSFRFLPDAANGRAERLRIFCESTVRPHCYQSQQRRCHERPELPIAFRCRPRLGRASSPPLQQARCLPRVPDRDPGTRHLGDCRKYQDRNNRHAGGVACDSAHAPAGEGVQFLLCFSGFRG